MGPIFSIAPIWEKCNYSMARDTPKAANSLEEWRAGILGKY